jgi:LIVCS family branched-chain amino acid:cation transporter
MGQYQKIAVTAFALFSLFFGAGNLILPPLLGVLAGGQWWLVTLGFAISAVVIPILGIMAHARIQGTIFDFAEKVSPIFSLSYSFIVYGISISLPAPRTASVTHEMAIAPFFDLPPLATSMLYFLMVLLFVLNRSKILNVVGKILTPGIIIILILMVANIFIAFPWDVSQGLFEHPITDGLLEGYQTFDAIGAVVVGGVIIISVNLNHTNASYAYKKNLIRKAGLLAGSGLLAIYAVLILSGALVHNAFDSTVTRTALLSGMAELSLGATGKMALAILVALACFTTAVGIVTGTSDFMKSRLGNSQKAYTITAVVGCVLGVTMGQFNVAYIIAVALPALMFIYPITIVLIVLNILPERYAHKRVFQNVVITTIIFSIPDFLESVPILAPKADLFSWIPFQEFSLGWVLPSLLAFAIVIIFDKVSFSSKD